MSKQSVQDMLDGDLDEVIASVQVGMKESVFKIACFNLAVVAVRALISIAQSVFVMSKGD